jgi:hypothetical protein
MRQNNAMNQITSIVQSDKKKSEVSEFHRAEQLISVFFFKNEKQ